MRTIVIAVLMVRTVGAEQLRITVYDKAKTPDEVRMAVADNLRHIFRQSGIDIEWVAGDLGAPEASVMIYEPLGTGHDLELACRARRDIALDIIPGAVPGIREQVLGMAQPLSHAGLNVRIFDDHIRKASEKEDRTYATVLSHAIAHEIGHVLLRSNTHGGRGLMSDVWTGREYDWMAKGALVFTVEDSRRMRATLSGAECSSANLTPTRGISEIRNPEEE
jgi:hypothetical protein